MSSSRSSSSSSTTTQQYGQRAGAEGGSIAATSGAAVTIDATTPEAWDFAGDVGADAFDLAGLVVASSFSQLGESQKHVGNALEAVRESYNSDAAATLEQLIKIGVPVLGAAFIANSVFRK